MKKIVLDVDGVLLNFMPAYDKAAELVLKRKIIPQADDFGQYFYDLAKRAQCSYSEVDAILDYMQTSKMYERLDPLDGAKEALDKIKKAGFHITVVTALPEHAKQMRLNNLKNALDFVPDEIICVGMGKSKAEALRLVNPDVFVDDRIEYLSSAPFVHHLVWCDQKEVQKEKDSLIDLHVHSLKEWTDIHMKRIVDRLDKYYHTDSKELQNELKLESVSRKYNRL